VGEMGKESDGFGGGDGLGRARKEPRAKASKSSDSVSFVKGKIKVAREKNTRVFLESNGISGFGVILTLPER
jgi:hypothetical protein